ncbi:PEP-CTERM sorting domain-containing protein [uncultured Nostoc sp.]|uniref:PEP-CTERM sorting domain-containing protein n=1 Tax=uncultured Nostoc sp. TaxID=340711 RepID=UPI0035C9A8CA
MNKQLSTNALVIVISLLGVSSAITPASANFITGITPVTKTEVPKTVQSVTTTTNTAEVAKGVKATVQEITNTTVGQLAGVATDSTTTAQVKDPSQVKLPSLDNPTQIVQTIGQAAVGIKADQQSTQADAKADLGAQIPDLATVGICLDASAILGIVNKGSSANCSKAVETPPVGLETLPVALETLPVAVETPPVAVKTPPIAVEIPPVAIKTPPVAVEIPPVEVEKFYVAIKIPSVGVKPHSVPEPTTLGGLALLGVYFISRRRVS